MEAHTTGKGPQPSPATLLSHPFAVEHVQPDAQQKGQPELPTLPPSCTSCSALISQQLVPQQELSTDTRGSATLLPQQVDQERLPLAATVEGSTDTVQDLLRTGARPEELHDLLSAGARPEDINPEGQTPLHLAAKGGREDLVIKLLKAGAIVDAVDKCGRTPLMIAAKGGHVEASRVLLQAAASPELHDKEGRTPLHLAAMGVREELVRMLLKAGAIVGAVDKKGRTALHFAAMGVREELVRMLLEAGAMVDAVDKEGRTPLHLAAMGVREYLVHILVEAGAIVNVVDKMGVTPLLAAIALSTIDMVQSLLDAGAEASGPHEGGLHPLGLAATMGLSAVAKALITRGSSASGLPLEPQALQRHLQEVANLLENLGSQGAPFSVWESADVPVELLAFHCRMAMVVGTKEDHTNRLVHELVQRLPATWPAVYCSSRDALAASSQTASLLKELAGSRQLAAAIQLLQRSELLPSGCPTLVIDKRVTCTAFSPDGTRLAVGTNSHTVMWDLGTGVQNTLGESLFVSCISFSGDSRLLACAYGYEHICVFDAASGKPVNQVIGITSDVMALSFNWDDSRLVCVTSHGEVHVIDTLSWQLTTRQLPCESDVGISSALLFPGQQPASIHLIICFEDSRDVCIYEVPASEEQGQQANEGFRVTAALQLGAPVSPMAICTDGSRIVILSEGQLQLWSAAAGTVLSEPVHQTDELLEDRITCMALSPDGRRLAVGRASGEVTIHECNKHGFGRPMATLYGHSTCCDSVAFSADGRRLITAGKDHTLRLWDAAFGNISQPARAAAGVTPPAVKDIAEAGSSKDHTSNIITIANTLSINSCFHRPLFNGGADNFIPLAYTPPSHDGVDGGLGAFSSPWVLDAGQHLDVTARGNSFGVLLLDLLSSPAARSAGNLRAAASSLSPHVCAAASMALLHIGPTGATAALIATTWLKLLERGLLLWAARVKRHEEEGAKVVKVIKLPHPVGKPPYTESRSPYTVNISEVAVPHATLALQGGLLAPLLADPWLPMSLWARPAIKALVLLRWALFTKHAVLFMFLIRATYTGLFIAYALGMTSSGEWHEEDTVDGSGRHGRQCVAGGTASGHQGVMYVLAVMTAEYTLMEVRQMVSLHWRWLNHTNVFDAAGLALMATILGLHWTCGASLEVLRGMSAVLILVLFWRLLYFAAAIDKLGKFVRMVLQVTADLRYFFIVLGVIYAGFALAVLVLGTDLQQTDESGSSDDSTSGGTSSSGGQLSAQARPVFMRLYTMIYGDFDVDMALGTNAPSPSLGNLAAIICSLYMFLVTIILLNLLIAVIGDAYDGVVWTAEIHAIRDKAQLIAETELLLPAWFRRWRDKQLFRCQRVLVLQPAQSEQTDGSTAEPSEQQQQWQGRVGHTERLIEGLQTRLESRVDAVQAQQGRLEQQLSAMQEQLDVLQKLLERNVPPT